MVYSGSNLLYMLQPEGTVSKTTDGYAYNYFKTDHTGSTRMLLSAVDGNLVQQQATDYYPFGMAWSLSNLNKNKYLFSGKEFQDDRIGSAGVLGLYDFGARYYNPLLGRWFNVDPKLQGLNPYTYCANNPVMFIDPNGELWWLAPMITGALFNLHSQGMSGNIHNFWDALLACGIGGLSGITGAGIGISVAEFADLHNILGFKGGFLKGFTSGFGGGFISMLGNSAVNGNNFGQAMADGMTSGMVAGLTAGLFSGLNDANEAGDRGFSRWNGTKTVDLSESAMNPATTTVNMPDSYYDALDPSLHNRINDELGYKVGDFGANQITTRPPKKYNFLGNGNYLNREGQEVLASYQMRTNGTGSMHISPTSASKPSVTFKAIVGHEFIHAYHNYIGLPIGNGYSDMVAYRFTAQTYLKAGMINESFNTWQIAIQAGFNGTPPASYRVTPFIVF